MEVCRARLEERGLSGAVLGHAWMDSPVSVDDLEARAMAAMKE